MAYDFPQSPANGTTANNGTASYRYDGVKWVAVGTTPSPYVAKSGDVMTGALTLPGNAASALQAVPLQQVPVKASTVPVMNGTATIGALTTWAAADHIHPTDTSRAPATGSTAYVAKGGDTMTGLLTVPSFTANTSDGFNITTTANNWPIIRYNNHRRWYAGGANDGSFCIQDDTAGRRMLTLDANGNVTTPALYATYLSSSGDITAAQQISVNGQYGIRFGSNTWFRFAWDGNFVNTQLDGGTWINLATTTWVSNNYVTRRICYQLGLDYSTNWYYGSTDGGSWFYARVEFITCDERIKKDIAPTKVDALATLCALPVEEWTTKPEVVEWFKLNKDDETKQRLADNAFVRIGITAQRAKEVDPGLVYVADQSKPIEGKPEGSPLPDDLLQCDSASFMPYFVRAIQQLNDKIAALEARL